MRHFILTATILMLFTLTLVKAGEDGEKGVSCPDAGALSGNIVSDVCWSCMFPMRFMGATMGSGSADIPPGATDKATCSCQDNLGVFRPGWTSAMWEPSKLVELVRQPGCSPVLNGAELPVSDKRRRGTIGDGVNDNSDMSFYHYHYYSYPLLLILDLWTSGDCNADGYLDLDMLYMSELDPTWNNDELAFFANPEAAAVANPAATVACSAEAITTTVGKNIDAMFWCAGSWGTMYPLSGYETNMGIVKNTSLLGARAVAALHRRGLAYKTMGEDTLCQGKIEPMLPKSQYKWSMMFPRPEAESTHVTGETVMKWGTARTIPGFGEDAVYLLWRWNDCCNTF